MPEPLTSLHFAFLSEGLQRPHATFESEEMAAYLGASERDAREAVDRLWKMKALHSDFAGIFIVTPFGRDLLERRETQQHINGMIEFGRDKKPPNLTIDPDAFVLKVNTTNPSLPKWGRLAFSGQIIRRTDFRHPNVTVDEWFQRDMIRHATVEEVEAFNRKFGEDPETVKQRTAKIGAFRAEVNRRVASVYKPSEHAAIFLALIKEWQEADNQCRQLWHHEFAMQPIDDDGYIRETMAVQRALILPVERGDILARAIKTIAEPLMVKSEGYDLPTTPFRQFFITLERQDTHPDVQSYLAVEELVQHLRLKLLHDEEEELKRRPKGSAGAPPAPRGRQPLRRPNGSESVAAFPDAVSPPKPDATPKRLERIVKSPLWEFSKHPWFTAILVVLAAGACSVIGLATWWHNATDGGRSSQQQTTPAAPNQVPTSQASAVNPPAGTPTPAYQTEEILQEVTVE
ncbi:MAG: hypothetical protein JWM57_3740, partial [Phycisphaerales bacterium]|nr:hypothetical protein [Phycisphaerales bacterium]